MTAPASPLAGHSFFPRVCSACFSLTLNQCLRRHMINNEDLVTKAAKFWALYKR